TEVLVHHVPDAAVDLRQRTEEHQHQPQREQDDRDPQRPDRLEAEDEGVLAGGRLRLGRGRGRDGDGGDRRRGGGAGLDRRVAHYSAAPVNFTDWTKDSNLARFLLTTSLSPFILRNHVICPR